MHICCAYKHWLLSESQGIEGNIYSFFSCCFVEREKFSREITINTYSCEHCSWLTPGLQASQSFCDAVTVTLFTYSGFPGRFFFWHLYSILSVWRIIMSWSGCICGMEHFSAHPHDLPNIKFAYLFVCYSILSKTGWFCKR